MTKKPPLPDKKARLAEALRDNLKKRKQQARKRSLMEEKKHNPTISFLKKEET